MVVHHTAGPWAVQRSHIHGTNVEIWAVNGGRKAAFAYEEADAHLIAAAPTMLDALTAALAALYDYGDSSVTGMVEAAIAQARGK
jgi:hypothetical protein